MLIDAQSPIPANLPRMMAFRVVGDEVEVVVEDEVAEVEDEEEAEEPRDPDEESGRLVEETRRRWACHFSNHHSQSNIRRKAKSCRVCYLRA